MVKHGRFVCPTVSMVTTGKVASLKKTLLSLSICVIMSMDS